MSGVLPYIKIGSQTNIHSVPLSASQKVNFADPSRSVLAAVRNQLVQHAGGTPSSISEIDGPKVLSRYAYMLNGRRDALRVYLEEENGCAVLRDLVERRDPLDFSRVDSEGRTLLHHMMLCMEEDIPSTISLLELLLRRLRDSHRYPGDIKPLQVHPDNKSRSWFLYPIRDQKILGPFEGENVITLAVRRPNLWEEVRRLIPLSARVQCLSRCYRSRSSIPGESTSDTMDDKELALAAGLSLEVFQKLQKFTTPETEYFHPLAVPYSPEQARRIDEAILLALTPVDEQRKELLALYQEVRNHLKMYARATARPELVARTLPDFEYILSAIRETIIPTNTSNIGTRRRNKNLQYRLFISADETGTGTSKGEREMLHLPFILHSLKDALSGSDSRLLFQWYWRAKRYSVATWTEAHLQFRQDPVDGIQRWSYVVQSMLLDHLQEATRLRNSNSVMRSSNAAVSSVPEDSVHLYRPLLGFSITGSSIAEREFTGGIILGGLEPQTPAGDFLYLSPNLLVSLLLDFPQSSNSSTFEGVNSEFTKIMLEEARSGHRQIWFHLRREEKTISEHSSEDESCPLEEEKILSSIYLEIFDRNDRLPSTKPVLSIPLPSPDLIFSFSQGRDTASHSPALMILTIPEDGIAKKNSITSLQHRENDRVILLFSSQYTRWSLPTVGEEGVKVKKQHYRSSDEGLHKERSKKPAQFAAESGFNSEDKCDAEDFINVPALTQEQQSQKQVNMPLPFSTFKFQTTSGGKLKLRRTQGYVIRAHLQTGPLPFNGECWTSDLTAVEIFQAIGPAAEDLLSFISNSLYLPYPIRGRVWKLSRPPPIIALDDDESVDGD